MRYRRDVYEWIDPVDTIERMMDEMDRREEEHEREASHMARTFSEQTYQIRRQAEEVMRPMMEAAALKMNIPMWLPK